MLLKCSFFLASKVQGYDSKQKLSVYETLPCLLRSGMFPTMIKRWTERAEEEITEVFSLLLKDEIV